MKLKVLVQVYFIKGKFRNLHKSSAVNTPRLSLCAVSPQIVKQAATTSSFTFGLHGVRKTLSL